MPGIEDEFDSLLGLGNDEPDVSEFDKLLGLEEGQDPLEEEFDNLLGLKSPTIEQPETQPEAPIVPEIETPQFEFADPTIQLEPEVSGTTNIDTGIPQGEDLPKYAPSRALGETISNEQPLYEPLTDEGIPTRAPRESTPLGGVVTGLEKSVPFFGKEGADIEQIEQEQGGSVIAGEVAGNVGQALLGGLGVGKVLAKTAVAKSPLLMSALSRVLPATGIRGGQTAENVIKSKTDIKDALFDTLVESGGGAAFSMIPEIIMPAGISQLIAQPLSDIMYQAWVDAMRNKGSTEGIFTKEWFAQQIPTIAMSMGFAIKDVAGGKKFIQEQQAMRGEVAKLVGAKPKITPKPQQQTTPIDQTNIGPVDTGKELPLKKVAGSEMADSPRHRELDRMIEEEATGKKIEPSPEDKEVATELPYPDLKPGDAVPGAEQIIKDSTPKKPEIPVNKVLEHKRYLEEQKKVEVEKGKAKPIEPVKKVEDDPELFKTGKDEKPLEGEGGFIKLGGEEDIRKLPDKKTKKPASKFAKMIKENFTSKGHLPDEVFQEKIERDGWVNAELKDVQRTVDDFGKIAPKAFNVKKLTDDISFKIDAALEDINKIKSLPEEIQPTVQKMRNHIDVLSQRMIDEGVIEGDMATKFKENIGFYSNRSFRLHDDPKWSEKVPDDVKNKAKAFLRQEILSTDPKGDISDDKLDGYINELLYKKDAPINVLAGGKLGSKKLGVLKRRKDIPPQIRALWGEYKDADVNYANSVAKMANIISNHKFLSNVKEKGKNKFLFDEAQVKDGESYHVKISSEDNPAMKPLAGKDGFVYTTKEIADAFESKPDIPKGIFKMYLKVNSAAKYSKTIGSFMTHVRNVTGNVGFAIANGHWDILKGGKALKIATADFTNKGNVDQREYIRELTELGVVGDGARAGEIREIIKDASGGDLEGMVKTPFQKRSVRGFEKGKEIVKSGAKFIEKAYGAEDDVWKIYAFENEMRRYKKAYPKMDDKLLKKKVATIVRDTYPTYSMIPKAMKALRRFPLVGTFISFPAEVMRTAKNTIGLAFKELQDPATRAIGSQRLVGIMTASTITAGAAMYSKYLMGINKEKEEAAREGMPPWAKHTDKIYTSPIEKGKGYYLDLGYSDPHSYLKAPIAAMINGEDWESKILETGAELLAPFLSEDMLASKLIDIKRNKRADGIPIYNVKDSFDKKSLAVMKHVWDAIEPGTISGMERVYKAYKNEEGKGGTAYDAKTEITAQTTGVRVNRFDFPKTLKYKTGDFKREIIAASNLKRSRGKEFSLDEKKKIYERFAKTLHSGKMLGMTDKEIFQILRDNRVSKPAAKALLKGEYVKYLNKLDK